MTTNVHTDITVGAPANASIFNAPLGQIDKALTGMRFDPSDPAFGAVFNGVADVTSAILAVIAAAPAGSVIWIPSGTGPGIVSARLEVSLNNIWFDGPGTLKLANAANHPIIRFLDGVVGGGVRNITLDGNKANNTGSDGFGNQGIVIGNTTGCTQVSVVGVRIQNTFNDGVYAKVSNRIRVEGCYITGCGTNASGGSAIHFLQGTNDGVIIGNLCDANANGINVDSNNIANCLRNRIIGNTITNCFNTNAGMQQAGAISVQGGPYTIIEGNHCIGSVVTRGIYVAPGYSASNSDFCTISNNICNGNFHNGIDMTGNFERILGNHCEANGQSGIYLSGNPAPIDTTFNQVIGNTCINNGKALGAGGASQAGIVMNYTTPGDITDNQFIGNSLVENGTGSQLYGILQWTGPGSHYARNQFIGNNLKGNVTAQLSLLSTGDIVRDNGGFNPHIRQAPAFAASFTPDLTLGDYIAIGALTGGITMNAFAAAQLYPGQVVTFQFTQDGTGGRQITWNAQYKTGWQPTNSANSVSSISLIWDGTNWQQYGGQIAVDAVGQVDLGALAKDVWVRSGQGIDSSQSGGTVAMGQTRATAFTFTPTTTFSKDLRRSRQTPTEAVLVSGVDATLGENVEVTLTAARVVGVPLNPAIGQHLIFTLIQGGAGAFAVTWNAVFKKVWSDAGNATGARSSIEFHYNGTNWNQVGGQATYV